MPPKTRAASQKKNRSRINLKATKASKELKVDVKRKLVSDSNNNGHAQKTAIGSNQLKSPNPTNQIRTKRTRANKNISLRVLDDKKKSSEIDTTNIDVYEFTYDPNEEPPPKKKKKKSVKKNTEKPKTVTFKSNYDKNLAKALAALKNTVAAKSSQKKVKFAIEKLQTNENQKKVKFAIEKLQTNENDNYKNVLKQQTKEHNVEQEPQLSEAHNFHENAHNSVRVEDIALQFQEDNHDINYSPISSPCRTPTTHQMAGDKPPQPTNADPLNLNEDLSFFDEIPVASSSMNSSRHPLASPWRVEFNNLPIKWTVNTYVKPNMTPSVETSFNNFNEGKKKHVYTNLVLEEDEPLPIQESTPNLKQTSILSFIKEMVEKSAKKKKKLIDSYSVFNNVPSTVPSHITPVKNNSLNESLSPIEKVTPESVEKNDNNVFREKQNIETQSIENNTPNTKRKHSTKKKNKDITYFGFDDSENQENISPVKINHKAKNLRLRSHAVLKEINGAQNPGKAATPLTAKYNTLAGAGKQFDEIKSATEPPSFPEVHVEGITNVGISEPEVISNIENDDSLSVHLFEDIDVVHHLKPHRKSYSKTKKVTFRKNVDANSSSDEDLNNSGDDMEDESFRIPSIKDRNLTKKKKTKKPKLSKKEEKEVEAWAAGFNSMCEDVEEFVLVVE